MLIEKWNKHVEVDDVRNNFILPRIINFIDKNNINSILDIGSGSGYIANELIKSSKRKIEITCIEKNKRNIDFSKEKYDNYKNQITYINSKFENLDFSKKYDINLIIFTLLEFKISKNFINNISKSLNNFGFSYIIIPDFLIDIVEQNNMMYLKNYAEQNYVKFQNKHISSNFKIPFIANRIEKIIEDMIESNFVLVKFKKIYYNKKNGYYELVFQYLQTPVL